MEFKKIKPRKRPKYGKALLLIILLLLVIYFWLNADSFVERFFTK